MLGDTESVAKFEDWYSLLMLIKSTVYQKMAEEGAGIFV